jgi:hypothetical protein
MDCPLGPMAEPFGSLAAATATLSSGRNTMADPDLIGPDIAGSCLLERLVG